MRISEQDFSSDYIWIGSCECKSCKFSGNFRLFSGNSAFRRLSLFAIRSKIRF
jgi:hypothetical protein